MPTMTCGDLAPANNIQKTIYVAGAVLTAGLLSGIGLTAAKGQWNELTDTHVNDDNTMHAGPVALQVSALLLPFLCVTAAYYGCKKLPGCSIFDKAQVVDPVENPLLGDLEVLTTDEISKITVIDGDIAESGHQFGWLALPGESIQKQLVIRKSLESDEWYKVTGDQKSVANNAEEMETMQANREILNGMIEKLSPISAALPT